MDATEKQVTALQKFAKNKELNDGILKGIKFNELSKAEATELIGKCYDHVNSKKPFIMGYSQNYRNGDGTFKTVGLSQEELEHVRQVHREHCAEIMNECMADHPDDIEMQLAVFDKRADKIFSWIQQALDDKVRKSREK